MQTRRLTAGPTSHYAVIFQTGDEPMAGLTGFAREAALDGAHFTAIGAFERVTLGWFDLATREYRRIEVDEQVEVLSLVGDVTRAGPRGDEPKVHAHVVVGRADGAALGGHLLEARVRPTLEVVLTETPAVLRRRDDPATGLALIDLAADDGPG